MSNNNPEFDIFNLDNEAFVKPTGGGIEDSLYKPFPENGKDGVYKSLIRFLPNVADPKKSKIHKYYVWLKDPTDGASFPVDCPSTVGKKSILKDLYWQLKNSGSAKDQELSKVFSRKEDYYSLVQIVKDANKPDLEGKIMILKFGKKVNEIIEQLIKPEFGTPCNPYDLFEGKLFGLQVRKVGEWNNYDLCGFVGEKMPLMIDGKPLERTPEGQKAAVDYLQSGPKDLVEKHDYKEWTDETHEKVTRIINNIVPDGRLVAKILQGSNGKASAPASSVTSAPSVTSHEDLLEGLSKTPAPKETVAPKSSPSLDDLYNDL